MRPSARDPGPPMAPTTPGRGSTSTSPPATQLAAPRRPGHPALNERIGTLRSSKNASTAPLVDNGGPTGPETDPSTLGVIVKLITELKNTIEEQNNTIQEIRTEQKNQNDKLQEEIHSISKQNEELQEEIRSIRAQLNAYSA